MVIIRYCTLLLKVHMEIYMILRFSHEQDPTFEVRVRKVANVTPAKSKSVSRRELIWQSVQYAKSSQARTTRVMQNEASLARLVKMYIICSCNKLQSEALICILCLLKEYTHTTKFNMSLYTHPSQSLYILLMFSFNSVLQSLSPSKLVSGLANNYNKLRDKILPPIPITQILPNIFHLDFPQTNNLDQISQHIGTSPYIIWNISEYEYQDGFGKAIAERKKQGQLKHLNFEYYNNLPFYELIEAIREIQTALKSKTKIYVHCQQGKVRSAVFLSSYLFVTSPLGLEDISEAIHHVNKKLGINLESKGITYKNQHTLFKNLVNYTTNKQFINRHRLELQRISINNAPRIKPSKEHPNPSLIEAQVVLEIRCGTAVVHKCVYKDQVTQGESICIRLGKGDKKVLLGDEFLIIVKYLFKNTMYNILRIQSNTNFIFNNFARLHQHDVDISSFCHPHQQATFIDLTFKEDQSLSKLSTIDKPSKAEEKPTKQWDLLSGQGVTDSNLYPPVEQRFEWMLGEEQGQIDDNELNSKIEQVIKNMSLKEEERGQDRTEEEEQDLDDYLDKLESQAS